MKQVRRGKYTKRPSRVAHIKKRSKSHFDWFWSLSRKKKAAVIAAPILAFLIITPIATYLYYAKDISDQERLMNRNNTGVVFNDRSGKTFYSIGRSQKRELVPLDKINDSMEEALIASEDKNFYEHGGFSIFSILGALFTNLSQGDLTAYGGSTLTQQLAKNTLLSQNKSFLRKYQELAVSVAIERQYTKDQILEMYLNSVYYGENAFGIQEAAKKYFDTTPDKLTLAQSSMLVGVLPAPSAYSPISGDENLAKKRQGIVLDRMVENEYISDDEKEQASATKLSYAESSSEVSDAPHFVDMVMDQLDEKYGHEQVMRSGYQVETTLDLKMQQSMKRNIDANMSYVQANNGSNAGGIAIDPKSGQVLALVGSVDYSNKDWGMVNMATTARQPGSTFKSLYYAGALAEGSITPSTEFLDEPININGWQPKNADRQWHGEVTVRNAISQSLNIPSIKVMQKYGLDKSIATARDLGITTLKDDGNYGLALAIGSAEVPLIEMTSAYSALANKGQRYDTSIIRSIDDKFGKQIYTATKQPKRSINEAGAFLISDILSDNQARASVFGSSLTVPNHTVAVKTGTTDDNRDAWTIGYTPSLVAGFWVGNNDNAVMYNGGSGMAGPMWVGTMSDALAGKNDEKFSPPSSVTQRATCYSNHGLATNDITFGTYKEYYLASALPSKTCTPEKPKPIEVCRLADKKVESIDEADFDDKKYSRNLDACKKEEDKPQKEDEKPEEPTMIEVCDTTTGEIVTIDEADMDESRYSTDTENCEPPTGPAGDNGNTSGSILPLRGGRL